MRITPVSLKTAVSEYINDTSYQEYDHLIGVYMGYKNLINNFSILMEGIGSKLLRRLADDGIIEYKKKKNNFAFSVRSIAEYKVNLELLNEHFYEITEALKIMGMNKHLTSSAHVHRFKYLNEHEFLKLTFLKRHVNKKKYFVKKDDLISFLNSHINLKEAAEILNIELITLRQYWLNKYNGDVILFHQDNPKLCYLNKVEWSSFAKEKEKYKLLSRDKASQRLNITIDHFNKVVEEFKISPEKFKSNIETTSYFKESDIKNLITIQTKLLKEFRRNYYTIDEASEALEINRDKLYKYYNEIEMISPPPLIRTNYEGMKLRKPGPLKLYLKNDVTKLSLKFKDKRDFDNILNNLQDSSVNVLLQLLSHQNVKFSINGVETQEYWFKFVSVKLNKSQASDRTKRNIVYELFLSTQTIVELTKQKEIFKLSTKEIIVSVFNYPIPKVVKLEIYKFLKQLEASRNSLNKSIVYNTKHMPNLYKENVNNKNEKTIYSIQEFLGLIDFLNKINFHKIKSIDDALVQVMQTGEKNTQTSTFQYDSVWLYTILHMNNAWRHSDFISFPRFKLDNTRLSDFTPMQALEFLKKNDLNKNEIQELIAQAKALPLFHSKTKKRRYFFCSKDLESALAHAIVICELRVRIMKPLAISIIDLNNKRQILKVKQEKYFFQNFKKDFCFKSKQMNRTLISLVYSVIKKTTSRNPLEVTKYIRSHSDVETTNIYIDIPQEHMNFISKQLFDLGPFGYAYETLYQLVKGELPDSRENRTLVALNIKEIFGDFYEIENLARSLNRLSKEHFELTTTIKNMDNKEKADTLTSINLGMQPAKKEGFQCIYRKCAYPNRECNLCPYAIHHFYYLSELGDNLFSFIKEYKEKFHSSTKQGEKIHLANILYSYLAIIKQAINAFGEKNVSLFLKNGLDGLKDELSKIESSKNIITIASKEKI